MHTWLVLLLVSGFAPAPATISSLNPNSLTVGAADFTLTVIGTGFTRRAEVRWDGTPLETTFVSETRLTAVVPANNIDSGGAHQVTVVAPGGNGGTSNALTFTVNNPVPSLASISPSSAQVFSGELTLTVNGANFVSNSVVRWKGANRSTTFVSASQLTAAISEADLTVGGPASVTVFTPAPTERAGRP